MKTGIPRSHHEVTESARELGYRYSHATGGHHFYVKDKPDTKLGQAKVLTIPYPKIKGTGTLRNILKGMAYFKANGLGHDGQPRTYDPDPEEWRRIQRKEEAKFVNLTREWKKAMKQFNRHVIDKRPGPAPMRKPANGNNPAP